MRTLPPSSLCKIPHGVETIYRNDGFTLSAVVTGNPDTVGTIILHRHRYRCRCHHHHHHCHRHRYHHHHHHYHYHLYHHHHYHYHHYYYHQHYYPRWYYYKQRREQVMSVFAIRRAITRAANYPNLQPPYKPTLNGCRYVISGPLVTTNTPSYQCRDSHYKPETAVRPS